MSSFMDNLYDKIQQNSAKRHRTVSLLMVMSIFVTSGVVWVLRGTGITMVNDPICDVEEHEHSADCIRKTLTCMVEDETHIHEDACYLTEVICPKQEHIHIPACYTDQLLDGYIVQEDPEPENYIELESAEVSDAEEPSSEDVQSEESGLPDPEQADSNDKDENESDTDENSDDKNDIEQTDDDATASGDSEASEEEAEGPLLEHGTNYLQSAEQAGLSIIPEKEKVDNRADGIIIHLFDYGTEGLDHGRSDYRNPAYVGINEGRNLQDDILFFSYGTPSGEAENYVPTKNNYSGDYNSDPPVSGNRPVQGIVNNTLTDGFPTIAGSNQRLDYLFDMTEVIGSDSNDPIKIVYEDINHFLQKDATGKYFFDSSDNYAYYNPTQGDHGDFVVYNGTFDIQNDDHHTAGGRPYNPAIHEGLVDERYETELNPMKIGFFPFDAFDDSKVDPNFNATRIENEDGSSSDQAIYNHHFGMTMSANFVVPKDANGNANGDNKIQFNGQDIVFNYSGDDDMWVFVDDKLILDIGGIHEPTSGSINFTKNTVTVQDNAYGEKDGGNGYRYDQTTVAAMLGFTTNEEYWAWFTGQPHTIKMFYLERGGCYSNLAMDFNLPTVKTIDVTKNLDQGSGTGYENEIFRYELWTKAYGETEFKRYDGIYYISNEQYRTNDGVFFLKHGQTASFYDGLDTIEQYYVKEVGIDTNLISKVEINNVEKTVNAQNEVASDTYNFSDSSGIIWFQNTIRETYTDLAVQKEWDGGNPSAIDKIQFRLFQSKNGGEKIPVIVEGQRTFAIKRENGQWDSQSVTFTHLPSEYGRDRYTYTVDEVYVPNGYSSSTAPPVMINGVATIVITNTASSEEKSLHVSKEWYDNQGNLMRTPPQTSVKFKIKRSYIKYEDPTSTSFTVKTINQDTGIQTGLWTVDGVYVGGSVEFSLNVLNGIQVTSVKIDGNDVTPTYDIYEATNIQSASVVEVYYTDKYDSTTIVDTPEPIIYHSFTGNLCGWAPFNNKNGVEPTLEPNQLAGYETNDNKDGLAIERNYGDSFHSDRPKHTAGDSGRNSGAYYRIDPSQLIPGNSYSFSMYVKPSEGNAKVALTLKYTSKKQNDQGNYPDVYAWIADVNANNSWSQLQNSNYTMPSDIDTSKDILVYVETPNVAENDVHDLFIDEFIVAPGGTQISVDPNTSQISITPLFGLNFPRDRFDGSLDGWGKRGNANVSVVNNQPYAGSGMLHVTDRTEQWNGVQLRITDFTKYAPGTTHNFSVYVRPEAQTNMKLTLSYTSTDGKDPPARYPTVAQVSNVQGGQWVQLSNTEYKIPDDVDTSKEVLLYVETEQGTVSFYVDEFVEGPVGRRVTVNPGDGSLQMDTLTVNLNADTAIPPLPKLSENLNGPDYICDSQRNPIILELENNKSWDMTVKLVSDSNKTHYANVNGEHVIYERQNYIYFYELEEIDVPEGYVVSYDKQGSSSTTDDAPMLIKNKYSAYELPPTGGTGTAGYYMIGVFLLVLSVLYGCYGNKRERRQQ